MPLAPNVAQGSRDRQPAALFGQPDRRKAQATAVFEIAGMSASNARADRLY